MIENPTFIEAYDLFVFDLDGTLVDSKRDITDAMNVSLGAVGLPPQSESHVARLMGQGSQRLIKDLLASISAEGRFDDVFKVYLRQYEQNLLVHTELYPGVMSVLEALAAAGKKVALLSNKRERFCRSILDGLSILDRFDPVYGGDTAGARKPNPKPLREILTLTGIASKRSLMIGDSPADDSVGKALGVDTLGLKNGFTAPSWVDASKPVFVSGHLEDMSEMFGV